MPNRERKNRILRIFVIELDATMECFDLISIFSRQMSNFIREGKNLNCHLKSCFCDIFPGMKSSGEKFFCGDYFWFLPHTGSHRCCRSNRQTRRTYSGQQLGFVTIFIPTLPSIYSTNSGPFSWPECLLYLNIKWTCVNPTDI